MHEKHYTGWDIGGAHLKVASVISTGELHYIEQFATPLWQGIECLDKVIPEVIKKLPGEEICHAVTMTAELADIFSNRQEGVSKLTQLCRQYLGESVSLYASEHGLVLPDTKYTGIASANWHASSHFIAEQLESGLFIDVGSTTSDIVPFANKKLLSRGYDDQTRMRFDELIYTGVVRTSLMALAQRVPFAGEWQPVCAEHFATTADVYRILGLLDEETDQMPAADNGKKDIDSSMRRLARMVGVDAENYPGHVWKDLAAYYYNLQLQNTVAAVQRMVSCKPDLNRLIVGAGAGRFLVESVARELGYDYIEFSDIAGCNNKWQSICNVCAPAVALAQLNRLRFVA